MYNALVVISLLPLIIPGTLPVNQTRIHMAEVVQHITFTCANARLFQLEVVIHLEMLGSQ